MKKQNRIEPFLRNKEVFLDLGELNLRVKRQLMKLGCKVLTLPNNLTNATSVFISAWPFEHYTKKLLLGVNVNQLIRHSRSARALKMINNMKNPGARRLTSKSSLLKAQALNPMIKFYQYLEIKARLDREVEVNHPHEYRFDFDMTAIKNRYPKACQYFITDAKGVYKIEPHIIVEPPKLYLEHPCDHQGSYFAKPRKQVSNKRKHSRLDIKVKVPKKRKQKVCDGCLRRYTDLDLHNKSKEHQEWYKSTNFDDIDEFINMVQRKLAEEERIHRERKDPLELTASNVQKLEQKVSIASTEGLKQKIDKVALALKTDEKEKNKLIPCSSPSKASVVTVNKLSLRSKISESKLGTRSSPDEGLLDRPSRSKVSDKVETNTSETHWFNPSVSITDPPDHDVSLNTCISSPNGVITKEQNTITTWSPKTLPPLTSSYETNFKPIKKLKKRKREHEQAFSVTSIQPPKVSKVAVYSNSEITTSEQHVNKPPFVPYQSTLQPRIIEALRIREYKSRSAKRRKRKVVNEVLYHISGMTKLKSKDTRLELHEELRTRASKQLVCSLKPNDSKSHTLTKLVANLDTKKKLKSCLTHTQRTLTKKPQQHKQTGRLILKVGKQSKSMVVVKRSNRKSRGKKRVRHAPREVTTIKGGKRKNAVKARRSSRIKPVQKSTGNKKGRLL